MTKSSVPVVKSMVILVESGQVFVVYLTWMFSKLLFTKQTDDEIVK